MNHSYTRHQSIYTRHPIIYTRHPHIYTRHQYIYTRHQYIYTRHQHIYTRHPHIYTRQHFLWDSSFVGIRGEGGIGEESTDKTWRHTSLFGSILRILYPCWYPKNYFPDRMLMSETTQKWFLANIYRLKSWKILRNRTKISPKKLSTIRTSTFNKVFFVFLFLFQTRACLPPFHKLVSDVSLF